MSLLHIPKASVSEWNPAIFVSDYAFLPEDSKIFFETVATAYEAPDITFDQFGPALVGGGFTLKSDEYGVVEDSHYLWPTTAWERTIPADFKLSRSMTTSRLS